MICKILPIAFDKGATRAGCAQGPEALIAAGLLKAVRAAGHGVDVLRCAEPQIDMRQDRSDSKLRALDDVVALTRALADQAYAMSASGLPVFLGGDHSVAAGTIAGIARRAAQQQRPLFVLWLDAHPDFHSPDTTVSGNLHGVPLAYVSGQDGFAGLFPPLEAAVDPERICMMGIRSVDEAERQALQANKIEIHDMAAIGQHGLAALIIPFLEKVKRENGLLHVSLDIDFLDPRIAPAVGTPVSNGVSLQDALLLMGALSDSGVVTSMDIVEYNPALDVHKITLPIVVDLAFHLIDAGMATPACQAA